MADTLDDAFNRIAMRRRDPRMRREDFAQTMAAIGGGIKNNPEILGMVGTGVKAGAQIGGGFAAKNAADFEAAQYTRNAGNAKAAAQRVGFDTASKTAMVEGKQLADAAASGGGVTNPTIMDLMGETAQRGKYLQEADQYKGDVEANKNLNQAAAAKMKGRNVMTGSILEGVGTGLQGFAKYRPTMPNATTMLDDDYVTDVDTGQKIRAKRYG